MTPGETGGCGEMLFIRAPKAAILYLFCIAAYGALLNYTTGYPVRRGGRGYNRLTPAILRGRLLRGLNQCQSES